MKISKTIEYLEECLNENKLEGFSKPDSNGFDMNINVYMMRKILYLLKGENIEPFFVEPKGGNDD